MHYYRSSFANITNAVPSLKNKHSQCSCTCNLKHHMLNYIIYSMLEYNSLRVCFVMPGKEGSSMAWSKQEHGFLYDSPMEHVCGKMKQSETGQQNTKYIKWKRGKIGHVGRKIQTITWDCTQSSILENLHDEIIGGFRSMEKMESTKGAVWNVRCTFRGILLKNFHTSKMNSNMLMSFS